MTLEETFDALAATLVSPISFDVLFKLEGSLPVITRDRLWGEFWTHQVWDCSNLGRPIESDSVKSTDDGCPSWYEFSIPFLNTGDLWIVKQQMACDFITQFLSTFSKTNVFPVYKPLNYNSMSMIQLHFGSTNVVGWSKRPENAAWQRKKRTTFGSEHRQLVMSHECHVPCQIQVATSYALYHAGNR